MQYSTLGTTDIKVSKICLGTMTLGNQNTEKEGQEALKAWVVKKDNATVTDKELIEFCKDKLAPYSIPRRIGFIDELPKSAVGKTLRRELIRLENENK